MHYEYKTSGEYALAMEIKKAEEAVALLTYLLEQEIRRNSKHRR